jgi:hypothetical protein
LEGGEEEMKTEDLDKKDAFEEDENVTAEVFEQGANNLVEESREVEF